jgi:long-chain acyl-CoA synthetase
MPSRPSREKEFPLSGFWGIIEKKSNRMNAAQREITTIWGAFACTANRYPDNALFHFSRDGWKIFTYRDALAYVAATASHLVQTGLKPGCRVAIISENRPEWCSAYLSVIRAGGIAVPIDPQLGPEEIGNLLTDSESEIVFHSRKTFDSISTHLHSISGNHSRRITLINFDAPGHQFLLNTRPAETFPAVDPGDVASIIYTSGTTGKPKGVMLTHANFCADAAALIDVGLVSRDDNVLSVLPLHHTYAFMCTFLVPLFLGASITYPASLKGPDLMAAVGDNGVTVLIGVPQLLAMIRNGIVAKIKELPKPVAFVYLKILSLSRFLHEKYGLGAGRFFFSSAHRAFGPGFRFFASGGARLDPGVMKDLEAIGFPVLEGYGLTETSPVVTFNPLSKRKPGSAGVPLPSVELRIRNPAENGEGEIEIRGPMVMKGYYRNPSATADVMDNGWFRTGDIGRTDEEGYLFVTGRSKEVIVLSSGKNIYPEEVEKLYLRSPLIKELCIVGAEEEEESLHAVIVPDREYANKARVSDIREAIKWEISELSAKVPAYMRVTGFSVRTEPLPRTPLGKLRRFLIQAEFKQDVGASEEMEGKELLPGDIPKKVATELKRFVKEGRRISLDADLELDLGFDSLAKIELLASLERVFSLKLPEDFLADVHTVKGLIEKISGLAIRGYSPGVSGETTWREILFREPSPGDLRMVSLERPESRMLPSFLAFSVLKLLFKVCFRLEARAAENLPKTGNFIIAPNHTSYLDGFAVVLSLPFAEFKNLYLLGLSDYFAGPVKSRFAKIAHVIPIDSSAYLNKALHISAYVMRNGRSLLIFPEGGRSPGGTLLEFKKGVGILAAEMGVAVVPVCISGAFDSLPRGAVVPRFRKITVTFGEPLRKEDIEPSKKPAEIDEYQYFASVLRERVERLREREES